MKIIKLFFTEKRGSLLQVLIAIVVVGTLSYHFWTDWGKGMYSAGAVIRERLESEQWLSK